MGYPCALPDDKEGYCWPTGVSRLCNPEAKAAIIAREIVDDLEAALE